ncbi:MAG: glycosyltransferase family 2 protein, partial [Parasporobacterium sp.]|nr:glycosyltransferase family 2 protein [Parasporobacterium sp.]
MKQKLQIYNTNRAIVFTTSEQPLDPYLGDQIDKRFEETCSDALILGQGPVLSFGYLDPRDFLQTYPNNSSFAVSKDAYNEIGDIDFSLRSASAADYFVRLKENKKNISLAFDIIMPCVERRPNDVSDLWADSLLLDSKHGNIRVKVEVLQDWVNAVLHYDSGIGNYSRRNLIKRAPDFLFNYIKNLFYHKSNREEKIKYYVSSTLRGEFRLEESQPIREPLVSIVVRTCGRPDTLKLTLDSLRYQTYKNFEVIV